MWENLVDLQPQTGGSGTGISRDEFINNVAKDIQVRNISDEATTFFYKTMWNGAVRKKYLVTTSLWRHCTDVALVW